MSNYLPHYAKKKQILEKRERELRHALKNNLGEAQITRAAERVRDAKIRTIESALAQIAPSLDVRFERQREQLKVEIERWQGTATEVIVARYEQQVDLVALMRAGRLEPSRVSMAAYLGDERALATGVEPWVPSPHDPQPGWGPVTLLFLGGHFSRREAVHLACLCVERVVALHWGGGPEPLSAVRAAQAWCLGALTREEASVAAWSAHTAMVRARDVSRADLDPGVAFSAAVVAHAVSREGDQEWRDCAAASTRTMHEDELAWQAQAVAEVLLDPDWPPWRQDTPRPST
jgi:hypothetical protein